MFFCNLNQDLQINGMNAFWHSPGFQDFQDLSLVYCSAFDRRMRYCSVGGELYKLESLCYRRTGEETSPLRNVRGAMILACLNRLLSEPGFTNQRYECLLAFPGISGFSG